MISRVIENKIKKEVINSAFGRFVTNEKQYIPVRKKKGKDIFK